MSEETKHPFQPGTKVVMVYYPRWNGEPTYTPSEVHKVHKTGKFTLTSDPKKQFKAHQSYYANDDEWHATSVGGSRFSTVSDIRMPSPKLTAEIAKSRAKGQRDRQAQQIRECFSRAPYGAEFVGKIAALLSHYAITSALGNLAGDEP